MRSILVIVLLAGTADAQRWVDGEWRLCGHAMEQRSLERQGLLGHKDPYQKLRRVSGRPTLERLEDDLPAGWRLYQRDSSLIVRGPGDVDVTYPTNSSWTRARAVHARELAEWKQRQAKRKKAPKPRLDPLPTIDSVFDRPPPDEDDYPKPTMRIKKPRCEVSGLSVYAPIVDAGVMDEDAKRIQKVFDRHCKRVR